MERKTDLETALAVVMLLAVVLYFVVPAALSGLGGSTGTSAQGSVVATDQPSGAPSGQSVEGGVTLAPESSSSASPSQTGGDVLGTAILPFTTPSALPTSTPPLVDSTHGPGNPPNPQPTVIRPTNPIPRPTTRPNPPPTPTPTPTPTPQPQTVSFTVSLPGAAAVGDTVPGVDASASSGLPVTVSASGACSLAGGVLTFDAVGQCTIVASQAGDANWQPASASQTTDVS
ncbi:MAG TPA: hypothetical protein VFM08_06655 [Nocardioides sp.]|nr:hypothetical protein [Nocardioides sp.]